MTVTPLFKFIFYSGAAKTWKDGDSYSFYWKWWHPLTWVAVPLLFIIMVGFEGIPYTCKNMSSIGVGLDSYWKGRPKEYVSIWDRPF